MAFLEDDPGLRDPVSPRIVYRIPSPRLNSGETFRFGKREKGVEFFDRLVPE
jgi:hypothetical protein